MTVLTEPQHNAAVVVALAAGNRSLKKATILAGSGSARVLLSGEVLSKQLAGTAASAAAGIGGGANTGDGTMGAVTVSGAAKPGVYALRIIELASNAGTFIVTGPDGKVVASGTVAVAFDAGGLAFTLADGSTDFAAGDGFDITVTETTTKYLAFDQDNADPENVPAGILLADTTAPDGTDVLATVIVRDAEVHQTELVWPSDITGAEQLVAEAQLETLLGIIVR
jgi:hypothetical protein